MNVTILKEENHPSYITGGGCAALNLEIAIDPTLPCWDQRDVLIHEVIEGYLPCLPHDKVEELTEILNRALEEL